MKVDVAKAAPGQLRDVRGLDEPTEGVAGPKADLVENDVQDARRSGRCRIRNWKCRLRHVPGPAYLSRKDLPFMVGFHLGLLPRLSAETQSLQVDCSEPRT